ncbi:MAG: arginine--tRNA ligase [Candidatus Hodarchaeales archaeon]
MLDKIVIMKLQHSILKLTKVNKELEEIIRKSIESPPTVELGERSSNICFKLAKVLRKSPIDIAQTIAEDISKSCSREDFIVKVEAVKGYLNFHFNISLVFSELKDSIEAQNDNFGKNNDGFGRKIVIEHTSINPVKPLHIGNLRNAILGDVIARLYEWNGWEVEIQNLIDDFGKQVATLIWGLLNGIQFEISRDPLENYDVWLGRVYSQSNLVLEKEGAQKEVDKIMVEMRKNPEIYRFMRSICQSCVDVNLETAWKFGITYNYLVWESDISKSGIWEETFNTLKKHKNFYFEKEGANKDCFVAYLGDLVEFQDKKNPVKIFIRSNGVPTYVAHDVALQMWKFGLVKASLKSRGLVSQTDEEGNIRDLWSSTDLHLPSEKKKDFGKADRVCNVIGVEQEYLQEIVRYSLKLLNLEDKYQNSFHLSYKHVNAPHARFSGRSGNWYEERAWAEAVYQDTFDEAFKVITSKRPDLELEPYKRREITRKIAIGAIRYWLTKFSTETEIKFRIEDATSFEGDTGPFLVYAYVRAKKILEKLKKKRVKKQFIVQDEQVTLKERQLILELLKFPDLIRLAASSFQPIQLTKYAFDLASSFNRFYETSPVINAETPDLKSFRVTLVKSFIIVMKNTLRVLGIPLVYEM